MMAQSRARRSPADALATDLYSLLLLLLLLCCYMGVACLLCPLRALLTHRDRLCHMRISEDAAVHALLVLLDAQRVFLDRRTAAAALVVALPSLVAVVR